jgi:hypothetical protein
MIGWIEYTPGYWCWAENWDDSWVRIGPVPRTALLMWCLEPTHYNVTYHLPDNWELAT